MKEHAEREEHSSRPPAHPPSATHVEHAHHAVVPSEGCSAKELVAAPVEAVVTVPGSLEDRQFPQQLSNLQGNLRTILRIGENQIHVRRVEPWNSVRITFAMSAAAASRLQALVSQPGNQLAEMGVLTVRVGESNPVSMQVVQNTVAPQEPPAKKPKSDKKGRPRKIPVPKLPPPLPLPLDTHTINGDTSAMAVLQHVLSSIAAQRGADQPSTSKVDLQPNVVATTSQPIPIPSGSVMAHPAATGPFPFSSMTKVAYTLKNTMTSATSSSAGGTLTTAVPAGRPAVPKTASPSKGSQPRNIALTSPLLVNLLQSSEASGTTSTTATASVSTATISQPSPPKRTKKKKPAPEPDIIPPPPEPEVKKPARPRKRKKVETANGVEEVASPGAMLVMKDQRIAPRSESSSEVPTSSTAPTFITVFALSTPGLTRTTSSSLVWSAPAAVTSTASTGVLNAPVGMIPVAVPVRSSTPLAKSPGSVGEVRSPSPAASTGRRTPKSMPAPLSGHGPHQPTVANGESSTSSMDSGISLGLTGNMEDKGSLGHVVPHPVPPASVAQRTAKTETFTVINTAVAANPASRMKMPLGHPANGPLKVVTLVEHKIGSSAAVSSSEVKLVPPASPDMLRKPIPPPVPSPSGSTDMISNAATAPSPVSNHVDMPMEVAPS